MSDLRETFPTLQNSSSEEGEVLHLAVEGEAVAAKNAQAAFSFKDKDNNFVYPKLNNEGAIVTSQDAGSTLRARNKVTGSQSFTMIVELDLNNEKEYTKLSAIMSSTRTSIYEIRQVDDAAGVPVETVIGDAVTGSGQFTFKWSHDVDSLSTVGGTGSQKIRIYGKNVASVSDLRASVSCNEIA